MKLNIIRVGITVEHNGEVVTAFPGEEALPPDSIVVVMDKESWEKLKQKTLKGAKRVYTNAPNQAKRG